MTAFHQKFQILESLDSLDQTQAGQVLDYIKDLQSHTTQEAHQQKVKREAMIQIRLALKKGRSLNPSF